VSARKYDYKTNGGLSIMKKTKVLFSVVAIAAVMALAAGCGSSEKPAAQAPPSQEQAAGHQGHSAAMPKEDPMPMMKDLDKTLQDVVRQVKAGQTMEAQKSAAQLVSTTDKVMPHMMDAGLKEKFRNAAVAIKDSVNSAKIDPSALENKVKAMQELMKQTTTHLQTMSH
jgi:predicted small lipoprotein YifL